MAMTVKIPSDLCCAQCHKDRFKYVKSKLQAKKGITSAIGVECQECGRYIDLALFVRGAPCNTGEEAVALVIRGMAKLVDDGNLENRISWHKVCEVKFAEMIRRLYPKWDDVIVKEALEVYRNIPRNDV